MSTKHILKISAICLIALGFSACCRKKNYCSTERIKIAFVGFNRSESRLLTLKRYIRWQYDKALDSADLVYNGNKPYDPNTPDTLWLSEYVSRGLIEDIYHGNDWQLQMPTARKNYLITDIKIGDHFSDLIDCNDNKSSCENPVTNFMINGDIVDGSIIYISKPLK